MKEYPILFNDEMVRAVLEGRKTQTRRIIKSQPRFVQALRDGRFETSPDGGFDHGVKYIKCPYGQVGDRLWVRECFSWEFGMDEDSVIYRATDQELFDATCKSLCDSGISARPEWQDADQMSRSLSRITLEITGIRVERLRDISQADAIAEGGPPSSPSIDNISREFGYADFPRSWFAQTWQSIYGAESWVANPWVWVIEFKVVQP